MIRSEGRNGQITEDNNMVRKNKHRIRKYRGSKCSIDYKYGGKVAGKGKKIMLKGKGRKYEE